MNAQVKKLEELLELVQRNRDGSRRDSLVTASAPAPAAAPAVERAEPWRAPTARAQVEVVEAPSSPPSRPEPGRKPAARERISAPEAVPAARAGQPARLEPVVEERPAAPQTAAPRLIAPEPARSARMTPAKPFRVSPAELTKAAGAVASVVSPHPDAKPVTFGELLRRSLSLRPR